MKHESAPLSTHDANQMLGQAPIGRLMLRFSIPCVLSLLVSALYNIVDQIFIGWGVGYLGNGATNVVFPITVIALAVSLLIGDGAAACLSLFQGRQDTENTHRCAGSAVTLSVFCGLLFTALFLLFRDQILWSFGATENNITYAEEYFGWLVLGIPAFTFTNAMNSIIRADGSPKFAMCSILTGCIINIICDPIAIFVLDWGMMGAAVATIFGQYVSALLALGYLFHTRSFRLRKASFRPDPYVLRHLLPLGISSFLTQISIVVIMGVMNHVLVFYGAQSKYGADIPLTVVGIVMKVFQIVVSISVGIAAGCQPIVGYNFGAGLYHRVRRILLTMLAAETVVGVIATLCFERFPLQIISIFGSEDALYNEFAVLSFRVFLSLILFCCLQKSTSIFLQSVGRPVLSLGLSLLRDFILSVPLAILLPRTFGVVGALYSGPIADLVSFLAALAVLVYLLRTVLHVTAPQADSVPEKKLRKA